jgi:demethylmenaquinone methyltransferase / 2-methoxy-6-polyprenyl-1,4-benzoquinol methylase
MSVPATDRPRFARELFAGIAPEYDRMGAVLSFGQDPRWRRYLVSRVHAIPGSWALDAASGTGLVARALAAKNLRVAALDPSHAMVLRGVQAVRARGLEDRIRFVGGRAEHLPFPDEAFDAVTFTYLLRYVADPAATVAELARVLRPGGVMASLEFHVPEAVWTHAGWWLHTRAVMPAIGWVVSPGWYRTGRFLGRDVTAFYRRDPLPVQVRWWQEAGMRRVRTTLLSNGAAVVTWAVKANRLLDG